VTAKPDINQQINERTKQNRCVACGRRAALLPCLYIPLEGEDRRAVTYPLCARCIRAVRNAARVEGSPLRVVDMHEGWGKA